jgi:hypothetical protein
MPPVTVNAERTQTPTDSLVSELSGEAWTCDISLGRGAIQLVQPEANDIPLPVLFFPPITPDRPFLSEPSCPGA